MLKILTLVAGYGPVPGNDPRVSGFAAGLAPRFQRVMTGYRIGPGEYSKVRARIK